MDIKIKEPELASGACYDPETGEMTILKSTEDRYWLCTSINHEFMHYLLHRLVGIRCCYQYDSISSDGELDMFVVL